MPPGTREFTQPELDRIRALTSNPLPSGPGSGHPPPERLELEQIHKATGRVRPFVLWELDLTHDAEAAYAEEVSGGPFGWE